METTPSWKIKAFCLAVFVVLLATSAAHAATFTVDSTADVNDAVPGDGICSDGSGSCTLRAAISEANALTGADTIILPAGTYTLAHCRDQGEQQRERRPGPQQRHHRQRGRGARNDH